MAKPVGDAAALASFFAGERCTPERIEMHERFAFATFASAAEAERALSLETTLYGEANWARAPEAAARVDAAAARDARRSTLEADLADVRAGVVVQRSHADRVAAVLEGGGHVVRRVAQLGTQRLLLTAPADGADVVRDVAADGLVAWVCLPLALDCGTLSGDADACAEALDAKLRALGRPASGARGTLRVRVCAQPPALRDPLVAALESLGDGAYALDPRGADVVACAARLEADVFAAGVSDVTTLGAGLAAGPAKTSRKTDRASRAYWKLEEALDRYGVGPLTTSRALDLGAAPGGWTEALADRGCAAVVAVDPGALDAAVAHRPEVTHLNTTYQLALDALAAAAAERFDVFVCDMCLHDPGEAIDALFASGPLLNDGALVVVAVKLKSRGKSTEGRDAMSRVHTDRLVPHLDDMAVYHLIASKARERTVVGRWRSHPRVL